MKRPLTVLLLLSLAAPALAAAPTLMAPARNLLTDGRATLYGRMTPDLAVTPRDATGDTYEIGILGQSAATAYYISDASPSTHLFDGLAESAGLDLAATSGSFSVNEAYLPDAGVNGGDVIVVEVTALDDAGAPMPWIEAGTVTPDGPFIQWRLDVGTAAGGTNDINWTPPTPVSVLDSGFSGFDSSGGGLGTFLLSDDTSNASGVSGIAIVGLGGADVAGFDLATIQVFWEVAKIPEPTTGMLCGLLALGCLTTRRRNG